MSEELPALLAEKFPLDMSRQSITGPFDGRAWRADAGDVFAGAVPVGVGLCTDLPSDRQRLGPQTV